MFESLKRLTYVLDGLCVLGLVGLARLWLEVRWVLDAGCWGIWILGIAVLAALFLVSRLMKSIIRELGSESVRLTLKIRELEKEQKE